MLCDIAMLLAVITTYKLTKLQFKGEKTCVSKKIGKFCILSVEEKYFQGI